MKPNKLYAHVVHTQGSSRSYPVKKITKNFVIVWYNDVATGKFRRKDGYQAGELGYTFWELSNIDNLNQIADENGGTWEGDNAKRNTEYQDLGTMEVKSE